MRRSVVDTLVTMSTLRWLVLLVPVSSLALGACSSGKGGGDGGGGRGGNGGTGPAGGAGSTSDGGGGRGGNDATGPAGSAGSTSDASTISDSGEDGPVASVAMLFTSDNERSAIYRYTIAPNTAPVQLSALSVPAAVSAALSPAGE